MNVLIVSPNYPNRIKEYLILPSLEICIIVQILKNNGHKVEMIDMKINGYEVSDLKTNFQNIGPDYVLIDDIPETHCNTKKIISEIRKFYGKKTKIVLRGEISSFEPKMIMERNPDLDYIIRYDDDYAMLKIIESNNKERDLSRIFNIAYKKDELVIVNDINLNYYDINKLPLPDRNIYDISKYLKRDSETIVRSSRGCPGHCLFCIKTRFAQHRLFSIERFCDEIEKLLEYGFTSFFFSDDTFAFSMERLEKFAKEIKKRNLKFKWTSNLRVKDITDEKIKLMKELGAYRVFIGLETINSKVSKVIGKNLTKDEIQEKIDILKKYEMQFHASFILGNPGDTSEDLEATLEFVRKIKPDVITFNLIKVYPGLDLYKNPKKYRIIMPDNYWFENDEWTSKVVMGTEELAPQELEKWSKRLLWEFIK